MSTEDNIAPMEEEEEEEGIPLGNESPSASSTSSAMDWEKVDKPEEGVGKSEGLDNKPVSASLVDNPPVEAHVPEVKAPENFDEYSFGSSDDDSNADEDDLEKKAHVTLDNTAFDMSVLQNSIEGSQEALELVAGKDVVMVVGKTGVGKSTLIQGIAGKRIHASFHRSSFSGQTATKTVFDAQDALPNFEIGHAKQSKTRSLSAFLRKDGDVVYLDSPGLEDTRGVEMDIATSALLSQVAKRCNSLRFVVLIHCASLLEDRGNAFRSVLQFANKFVQDFERAKCSFMFLFTHTDEIAQMSSICDAKKRLQMEIIQIAGATNDGDVREVLDFVRKSLKRDYPFADVLHPLGTDYPKLASAIQNDLRGMSDLASASVCNLTLSSKLKLDLAVQCLLERLQVALRSSSPGNAAEVKDVVKCFRYLSEYVDVECVHKASSQSVEIINDHKKELFRLIDGEFDRFKSPTADFEQSNAQAIFGYLLLLEQADDMISTEHWVQSKSVDLVKLQGGIIAKASSCKSFRRDFKKLRAWSEQFQVPSSGLFDDTLKKIMALFDAALDIISGADLSRLNECSNEKVSQFVENLMMLHGMQDFVNLISDAKIKARFELGLRTQEMILEDVKGALNSWTPNVADVPETTAIDFFMNDYNRVVSHARVLESMKLILEKHEIGINSLDKTIDSTLHLLEGGVIGIYKSSCDDLKNSSIGPEWESQLHLLRAASLTFAKLQGSCWKEMNSSLTGVIYKGRSILDSFSGELENMSQVTKQHGMRSGERLGEDLVQFKGYKWFDAFLPSGDEFVANACISIERTFQDRIDSKSSDLTRTITSLGKERCASAESNERHSGLGHVFIGKLGALLPELTEIDKFISVVGKPSSGDSPKTQEALAVTCTSNLEDYSRSLGEQATECTRKWFADVNARKVGRLHGIAGKLDLFLADAKALSNIQSMPTVAKKSKNILRSIEGACQKLYKMVDAEMTHFGGNFQLKSDLLKFLKSCSGMSQLKKQLPDYKDAQHQARSLVATEAQKLEAKIEASADWDDIDTQLETFQRAVVLDEYVSQEATARLGTLRRLREKKEGQVDEHLQEMIRKNNFKGIQGFLGPLAKSNDQIKKQKFDTYQDELVFNLELIVKDVKRCLDQESITDEDSLKSVASNMTILTTAKSSLQRLLSPKLNLASQINQLTGQIDSGLTPLLDQIFESIQQRDFVVAATNEYHVALLTQHLGKFYKARNNKRLKDAKSKYKRELQDVPRYVERFAESSFKDHDDNLVRSLTSLKSAVGVEDDSMKALASLYEKTRQLLLETVRDFLASVQESVLAARCYDDVLPHLHSLNRQASSSFRAHFPPDLLLECENLLDRLQNEKQEHDRLLEFGTKNVGETIELWGRELDKLESPSLFRRVVMFSTSDRASYKNLKKRLRAKINDRFNQADRALSSCDLRLVQECIDFLVLINKKLHKHVENLGPRVRKLQERCVSKFLELCQQAKNLLEANNASRFEEKFTEYRGFVIHTPCVLASKDGEREFSLVNQMLYESLVHQVDSFLALKDAETFDFASIRLQALRLRKLGDFFADRLTILNEETKQLGTSDKWLGDIQNKCSSYFSNGRDFGKIKCCIELGVLPSATKADVRRAFKEKARLYHPDKMSDDGSDNGSKFRRIKDAHDSLLAANHLKNPDRSQAFDEDLKDINRRLRLLSKQFMEEQRYELAEKLLFQLPSLKELDSLVIPKLKSAEVRASVCEVMKGHVEKMRVDVDTYWSERKYKELNDSITDLKRMETHFKSYPDIFATSWNSGIVESIEKEIESLGQKAKACLTSHVTAKKKEGDFRRLFIEMGSVLVELPSFKIFTKAVMSNILESCLDSAWGYSFLFELGLSLQKGEDTSDDNENRIAQMLVSEFSHFKEVMVMTWNDETSLKPAEDVVYHIKGEHRVSAKKTTQMKIDHEELLESFRSYEKQWKSLLEEYIKVDADVNSLVLRVKLLAEEMKPLSCDKMWSMEEKKKIPSLLAGVFALFTVLKSGASYNRIEAAAGSSNLGEKLLMKPHNIQVLSLLYMFGCGKGAQSSFDSQLMQIRTGEGKSILLGAATAMFGLLGFRVATVCYSDYLSTRDFRLFEEVFRRFGLLDDVKYSKISTFAEDSTAAKGNIREMTESLLRGDLGGARIKTLAVDKKDGDATSETQVRRGRSKPPTPKNENKKKQKTNSSGIDVTSKKESALDIPIGNAPAKEEILLIDEVDVFFSSEFYGKTYNQVIEFNEPEVSTILKRIWDSHSKGGAHRLRLNDIKKMLDYKRLAKKLASFEFLLDNEISLMLSQVRKVDEIQYYLDPENDRIGYKVMDSISYDVTYGYSTSFAYLKEADNLKDQVATLARVTSIMPISCGQFSYANISPTRIMGVSGTLEAIGQYEKDILGSYGLSKYVYLPSVYGDSNFSFDKAGGGICFESNLSNFYHKISSEINNATKSKRAVIVFFRDRSALNQFVASPTYRQLGRRKSLLTEDMSSVEKEYVISRAATAGQLTVSTAVFGRGTDFFCKDEGVEKNGGVNIIQTFLSVEVSEEIQIQGRTARQGKKGSYQMILLDSELESDFGVSAADKDRVAKGDWYDWLGKARFARHKEQCLVIESELEEATERDKTTHQYFDSLLALNEAQSKMQFKELYQLIKKPPVPTSVSIELALSIDCTGSMAPYAQSVVSTIKGLLSGQNALTSKLSHTFPETQFELRLGALGFRDIDDGSNQFTELQFNNGSHFTNVIPSALKSVERMCTTSSGGFDLAEDIIGAIQHCAMWHSADDWTSDIKFMMVMTDAPAHGLSSKDSTTLASSADSYSVRHPLGLTTQSAVSSLVSKDIDLFFCSFNPVATKKTEDELSVHFKSHPDNTAEHSVTPIPMVPADSIEASGSSMTGGYGRHIIFVLDESGSMSHSWSGVVVAYNQYIAKRKQSQSDSDLVSVVQFDSQARTTVRLQPLSAAPASLSYNGGGTAFYPAAIEACKLAHGTPTTHTPAIIFMSDGEAHDSSYAATTFSTLNRHVARSTSCDIELHVIAFGGGANQAQLQQIASASRNGKVHASSSTAELASVFVDIAATSNVATFLESEIAKRISEAVSDKLSLEYFGS